jgi:hypothetical protein
LVIRSLKGGNFARPRYFAGAPTRDQAKTIYWNDLKAMYPRDFISDISETSLTVTLVTGAEIVVVGLDKPQRIEGSPWDGGILDEYANMKAGAWPENVFPALADRDGWCDLIGVPEGRNHYFDTCEYAKSRMREDGDASAWGMFTWKSSDILSAEKVAEFRRSLDPRTFRQEMEASFETHGGVVLYAFDAIENVRECPLSDWRSSAQIHIGQDFNLNPMTSTVWVNVGGVDYQVDEIILDGSDTDKLVKAVDEKYPGAKRRITFYPDASGASGHTSSNGQTDHSILKAGGYKVVAPAKNPPVRQRLNLTNARFCAADGTRQAFVSPRCQKSISAYQKHSYAKDSNEPDKKSGYDHYVDATGYYFMGMHGSNTVVVTKSDLERFSAPSRR